MTALRQVVVGESDSVMSSVSTKLDAIFIQGTAAANTQSEAADTQLEAAQIPIEIHVTVSPPGSAIVDASSGG